VPTSFGDPKKKWWARRKHTLCPLYKTATVAAMKLTTIVLISIPSWG
jgi:hypothetical protein